ncbi:MAG: hypothetical protein ACR2LR_27930 [Hassallia sp.]
MGKQTDFLALMWAVARSRSIKSDEKNEVSVFSCYFICKDNRRIFSDRDRTIPLNICE